MATLGIKGVKSKVLEILKEYPTLAYSSIAKEVGVSRERVRQIASKNGLPPRYRVPKLCPICGKTTITKKLYCSRDCANKGRRKRISVQCYQCKKVIERTPGTMRNKTGHYFCGRACFSKSMVKNQSHYNHSG